MESFVPPAVATFLTNHPAAVYATGLAVFFLIAVILYQRYDSAVSSASAAVPALPGVFSNIADTASKAELYTDMHYGADVEARKARAQVMTSAYYDLVTSFYEHGWGQSFHFAPRFLGETFAESIARHEYQLAAKLALKPGQRVLDVGCGVAGPARNIVRFTGAEVIGINFNENQVHRANMKAAREGLADLMTAVQGDFLHMPFKSNQFDAAYAIEATCHAPERDAVFAEVIRVLKPGALFGSYEWVVTPAFNPADAYHQEVKKGIEAGDSLPDLVTEEEVVDSLRRVGFEVEEVIDLAVTNHNGVNVPWYQPFVPVYTMENFKSTPLGLVITHTMVTVLEALGLAPRGTVSIHTHLRTAAKYLRAGGEMGIFTPMLWVKARKPLNWTPDMMRLKPSTAAAASAAHVGEVDLPARAHTHARSGATPVRQRRGSRTSN